MSILRPSPTRQTPAQGANVDGKVSGIVTSLIGSGETDDEILKNKAVEMARRAE